MYHRSAQLGNSSSAIAHLPDVDGLLAITPVVEQRRNTPIRVDSLEPVALLLVLGERGADELVAGDGANELEFLEQSTDFDAVRGRSGEL